MTTENLPSIRGILVRPGVTVWSPDDTEHTRVARLISNAYGVRLVAPADRLRGDFNSFRAIAAVMNGLNDVGVRALTPQLKGYLTPAIENVQPMHSNIFRPETEPVHNFRILAVATLPGWDLSRAVRDEMMAAKTLERAAMVWFIEPGWVGKMVGYDAKANHTAPKSYWSPVQVPATA